MTGRYDLILFDLLTALLDSWSLWNSVAGDEAAGRRWRAEYLRITYGCGSYQSYETLVGDAAQAVGLSRHLADSLAARYADLAPWPEATDVLRRLHAGGVKLGVVTNCSQSLGVLAAERIAVPFAVVVTAETAGYYKPDPRPYQLALAECRASVDRCLFVAGSAYDLIGAARVGLPVWWHNRIGLAAPPDAPAPLAEHQSLTPLLKHALG